MRALGGVIHGVALHVAPGAWEVYMYVYIYIYIYICIYTCVYIYIYIYMHICICDLYI